MKKIGGIISIIIAVMLTYTCITTENITGYFSVPLMAVTGVFLLVFDNVYNKNYVDGFKSRNTQRTIIIILTVIWIIYFISLMLGFFAMIDRGAYRLVPGGFAILSLSLIIPIIPGFIIFRLIDKYSNPYNICKTYYLNTDEAINYYLSGKQFTPYSDNAFVVATNEAIFFPELFCLIPIDQIKTVENKKSIDGSKVQINLANGKKIVIYTKQYEDIMKAISSK